jgi:hypothetical protein
LATTIHYSHFEHIQGLAHSGVLFFRLPGVSLHTKLDRLTTVLEKHADALARGEFLA